MKLVWHIVRKDLRRMRVPLALWALVLIAKNEMGVDLLHGDAADLVHLDLMRMSIAVFVGVDVFVNLILVGLLVQEDALVGTNMFWFTRPITGNRLLGAKLLGAFVMFGVLPTVVSLRWWIACGYGLAEMSQSTLLLLDTQSLIVGAGLVVATLTRTVNRFLLGLLAAAVAMYVWWFMLVGVLMSPWATRGMRQTQFALLGVVALIAGVAVIGQRYLRRHTRRAFVTLSFAGIAATAIGLWWRWDWTSNIAAASAALPSLTVTVADEAQFNYDSSAHVYISYRFTGLPDDRGLGGGVMNSWNLREDPKSWSGSISTVHSDWADWQTLGLPAGQFSGSAHHVLKFVSSRIRMPAGADRGEIASDSVTYVRAEDLERIQQESPAFSGHLSLDLIRSQRKVEFTPRQAAISRAAGWSVRVAFAEWRNGLLFVRLVESRPLGWTSLPERFGLTAFFRRPTPPRDDDYAYYRLNRERGLTHYLGKPSGFAVTVGGQAIRWLNLTLDSKPEMEGATVAIVSYEPAGHIERDVHADHLALKPMPQ